jgi:shikimate kinase
MAKKNKKNTFQAVGNIYLTGFMCAGKTSAGRILARRLGLPFRDCDALVEKETGRTIGELVAGKGLGGFRKLEAARVRTLAAGRGQVVALGGGVYPSRRWKGLLGRTGVTVFLDCPWRLLEGRLKAAAGPRPLLAGPWESTAARARKLYNKRLPFYRQADITVKTAGLSPQKTAGRLARTL